MADEDQGVDDVSTPAPAADSAPEEAVSTPPKAQPGWVHHIATDTFHDVDDVPTVLAAYPGQYEETKAPASGSKKIGWPAEQVPAAG